MTPLSPLIEIQTSSILVEFLFCVALNFKLLNLPPAWGLMAPAAPPPLNRPQAATADTGRPQNKLLRQTAGLTGEASRTEVPRRLCRLSSASGSARSE